MQRQSVARLAKVLFGFFALALLFLFLPFASAQEAGGPLAPSPESFPPDKFYKAEVLSAREENLDRGALSQPVQVVRVKIVSGDEEGKEIEIRHGGVLATDAENKLREGETIIVAKNRVFDEVTYYVADRYRLPALGVIGAIFLALVMFFGRIRGVSSIAGLVVSIFILVKFVVPQILAGGNPLAISVGWSFAIAFISLYLAHGFNKKTSIALLATGITLTLAAFLSVAFVKFANLLGMGSEEAFELQFGLLQTLNFEGLLIGGIIIGALGVLDDITTTQVAAVYEIRRANPSLSARELYRRGLSVGREHITSLVNTLALAYAGASLPLLLLFSVNKELPAWVILNGELVSEEIVRTLVGSSALVLAVPIATFLAARFFGKPPTDPQKTA